MNHSIWKMQMKKYEPLNKNLKVKAVVVGGGIAGYLTAYELEKRGVEVVLIEANRILSGVTENTTAFITGLQGILYQNMIKTYGLAFAKAYYHLHENAILEYENLIKEHNIDCDFVKLPTYLFTRKSTKQLIKELDALKQMGVTTQFVTNLEKLNLKILGAIKVENQAMFHPIKFLLGLPTTFSIYENTRVIKWDLEKKKLFTKDYVIEAEHIIFATHFPVFNCPELFPFKMYQSKSYAIAVQNFTNLEGLYVEDKNDGLTFRNQMHHIIIGGGDHDTNVVKGTSPYNELKEYANKLFEASPIHYEWNTEDCMTMDQIPYIGRLNKTRPNIYVITGFHKWGMAKALMGAKLIADLVENKQNEFEALCSTNRQAVLKNTGHFLKHTATTTTSLLKSFLKVPLKSYKTLKRGDGGIFMVNGKKCGVFKDENDEFYFVNGRCAHLKCELKFDKHNKTFICPCHGSCYNKEGDILIEPTVKDIKLK